MRLIPASIPTAQASYYSTECVKAFDVRVHVCVCLYIPVHRTGDRSRGLSSVCRADQLSAPSSSSPAWSCNTAALPPSLAPPSLEAPPPAYANHISEEKQ